MKNRILKTKCKLLILFCGGNVTGIQPFYKRFLKNIFDWNPDAVVYGVLNGFYGITNEKNIFTITPNTMSSLDNIFNCLQTCRDFNPSEHCESIISTLNRLGITAVAAAGGDGTSRGIAALLVEAEKHGVLIPWIFVPSSIDGINLSTDTIGKNPAAEFITDNTAHLIMNSFSTLDCNSGKRRISIAECPGRDRNDLLISTFTKLFAKKFPFKVNFLPVSYSCKADTDIGNIYKAIDTCDESEHLCILVHEHAKIKLSEKETLRSDAAPLSYALASEIKKHCGIKCNIFVPGYLAQTNSFLGEEDISLACGFADKASELFTEEKFVEFACGGESFAVVKQENGFSFVNLSEFAEANK